MIFGQSWVELNAIGQTQPFSGIPRGRDHSVCFAIGNNFYFGTGGIDLGLSNLECSDFSLFTCSNNRWSGSSYFPGDPRYDAIAFSDSVNGYVLFGSDDNGGGHNFTDNWQFDPVTGVWTQMSSFPGTFRTNAFHFTVEKKLYFGNGNYNGIYYSDLWMYDPLTNIWIQKNDPPFSQVEDAHGFGIGSFGYLFGGRDSLNNFLDTVYKYDPVNDSWITAGVFPGAGITFSFATDSFGYAATGNDFYQYDPATTSWTMKANSPSQASLTAIGFSNRGYIIEGNSSVYQYDELTDSWLQLFNSHPAIGSLYGTSVVSGDTVYINSSKYNYNTDSWVFGSNSLRWLWKSGNKAGIFMNNVFMIFDFSTYTFLPATQPPAGAGICFTAGGRYFIGIGSDTTSIFDKHLYEYDFINDQWTQHSLYPGLGTEYMIAFGIDSFGYVGGGLDGSDAVNDFWMYDPSTDQWTNKASFPLDEGAYAFSAEYKGKGYIGLGSDGYQGNLGCQVFSYDVTTDAWTLVSSPFGCRHGAYAFSTGNNLFVGGGSYRHTPNYSDSWSDLWKYDDGTTSINEIDNKVFSVMTASSGNSIIISGIKTNSPVRIIDLSGRIVFNTIASSNNLIVNTTDFAESVYFVMVNDEAVKIGLLR